VKLTLKDFQVEAVSKLAGLAARAREDAREAEPQTLTLASPTGSGKTVIAAQLMERIVEGDEKNAPDPHATFLWITDQPELNEQTRRKFVSGSTTFSEDDLVTVDAEFKKRLFDPGTVYFLNTQKLGKKAHLVRKGDGRQFTIWDTINSTAVAHPGSFWVIVDEAHRGMTQDKGARDEARTIIQKFIKGSEGEIAPVPLLLGISATPERFSALLASAQARRTSRPAVTIGSEDVRRSGLIKEAITLYHPEGRQRSDLTLLRDAAELLKRYESDWASYAAEEKAPSVLPVLVVQVEDATKKKVTGTDLTGAIATIEDALGPLGKAQIGHAFQEGHGLKVGDRSIRYVAPADIQDDPHLRVVFFKRSLTTGWDCPRAEVMMSFRRANDKTAIAQLVGRMVRTPLARSVGTNDFLNSVSLYLPYYDDEALDEVIEYLTEPDPEVGLPARVQRGENLATYHRNSRTKEAFAAAAGLPTTRVEKVSRQTDIRRLLRFGRLLAWDKLDPKAPNAFSAALVKVLSSEHARVAKTKAFKQRVDQAASIDVRAVTVGYGETEPVEEHSTQLVAVAQNVDHAFAECGRRLGGGLHSTYLKSKAKAKGAPPVSHIKLELYALLEDEKVIRKVEAAAAKRLREADAEHRAAIGALADERRQLYRQVRRQAARPQAEDWELPESIEAAKDGGGERTKHLYSRSDGKFATKLNTWEKKVLDEALAEKGVVGWLRNDPRKEWSFSVAYQDDGQDRPMYPDLLVFRRSGAGVLCDVYEPHSLAYKDSVGKAKGLAELARDHGEKFGRIQLITELKKGTLVRLRLDDVQVRDKVLGVSSPEHLRQLFEQA
jgi:type III restriction enzyme